MASAFVNGAGSVTFDTHHPSAVEDPTGQENVYDFRLFVNGERVAISSWFQVSPIPLTVYGDGVQPGEDIGVKWSGFTPSGNDWIGLYCASHNDGTYLTWQRLESGQITGTLEEGVVGIPAPGEPGQYQWRLFRNGIKVSGTQGKFSIAGNDGGTFLSHEITAEPG